MKNVRNHTDDLGMTKFNLQWNSVLEAFKMEIKTIWEVVLTAYYSAFLYFVEFIF